MMSWTHPATRSVGYGRAKHVAEPVAFPAVVAGKATKATRATKATEATKAVVVTVLRVAVYPRFSWVRHHAWAEVS